MMLWEKRLIIVFCCLELSTLGVVYPKVLAVNGGDRLWSGNLRLLEWVFLEENEHTGQINDIPNNRKGKKLKNGEKLFEGIKGMDFPELEWTG